MTLKAFTPTPLICVIRNIAACNSLQTTCYGDKENSLYGHKYKMCKTTAMYQVYTSHWESETAEAGTCYGLKYYSKG